MSWRLWLQAARYRAHRPTARAQLALARDVARRSRLSLDLAIAAFDEEGLVTTPVRRRITQALTDILVEERVGYFGGVA